MKLNPSSIYVLIPREYFATEEVDDFGYKKRVLYAFYRRGTAYAVYHILKYDGRKLEEFREIKEYSMLPSVLRIIKNVMVEYDFPYVFVNHSRLKSESCKSFSWPNMNSTKLKQEEVNTVTEKLKTLKS